MTDAIKKICIITLCLLLLLQVKSSAKTLEMDLAIDGQIIKYAAEEVTLKVDGNTVVTKEMPPIIINERTLVPAREMFESIGAVVLWDNTKREVDVSFDNTKINLKINGDIAKITKDNITSECKLEVAAKIINSKTMIPFRAVAEAIGCNVLWIQQTRTILVSSPNIEDKDGNEPIEIKDEKIAESITKDSLVWNAASLSKIDKTKLSDKKCERANIVDVVGEFNNKDYAKILIKADGPISKVKPSIYDKTLVLDIENANKIVTSAYDFDSNEYVSKFRSSQYNVNDTRCVLDLKNMCSYSVELSKDRTYLIVKLYKTEITRVEYSEKSNCGTLVIEGSGYLETKVARLTDSDRIYVDIYNAISYFGDKSSSLKASDYITQIRTSKNTSNVCRIVLDAKDQFVYESKKIDNNKIEIKISKPEYKNIKYSNSSTYKMLIDTSNINKFDINSLTINEDYMTGNYSVIFDDNYENIFGTGNLNIYDTKLKSFEVKKENNKTKIIFDTTNNIPIAIKTYMDGKNLILEIVKPSEKYDKVLVLDPGHGLGATGKSDVGASVKGYYEKDYNLKLALNVKDYLDSNSDIKVYLTRNQDKNFANYIVKYENTNHYLNGRAELANKISADMFISIHNNSMGIEYPKWNGTEVLYNSNKKYENGKTSINGLSNKELATILSKAIVEGTNGLYKNNQSEKRDGTDIKDGVTLRTDLAVLNIANMPASLIELAFLTNPDDLAKLNDDNYIINTSEVIAKAIINIFDNYNL